MTKAELERLRESWRVRVEQFRTSGQSGTAWCAANQIKENQLWYWVRKFGTENRPKKSAPHWLPVQVHEPVEMTEHLLHVRIGQASIEVRAGFDPELLRDVVRTLATLC